MLTGSHHVGSVLVARNGKTARGVAVARAAPPDGHVVQRVVVLVFDLRPAVQLRVTWWANSIHIYGYMYVCMYVYKTEHKSLPVNVFLQYVKDWKHDLVFHTLHTHVYKLKWWRYHHLKCFCKVLL